MTREQFTNWVHKFGISSSVILLLLMLGFPVAVSAVYGEWPEFSKLITAIITLIIVLAPWWPAEYFGYMTVMGPGALYMSYITGNVTNLRMPATVGTMHSLGLEPNSDECHTMAIIACGASNLVTILLLVVALFFSVPLKPILESEALQPAFNYALPALFGGLVAQSVFSNKKQAGMYLILLAVCLVLCYCTTLSAVVYMIITVALGALIFYLFGYKFAKDKK